MYSQRVAAPPMQVSNNHDIEDQTSTCETACMTTCLASSLLAVSLLTATTAILATQKEIGGAVTAGILDLGLITALLTTLRPALPIKCPTISASKFGITLAGLATAIGLPLVIAGAVNHNERMALGGGLTMAAGIGVGIMFCCEGAASHLDQLYANAASRN